MQSRVHVAPLRVLKGIDDRKTGFCHRRDARALVVLSTVPNTTGSVWMRVATRARTLYALCRGLHAMRRPIAFTRFVASLRMRISVAVLGDCILVNTFAIIAPNAVKFRMACGVGKHHLAHVYILRKIRRQRMCEIPVAATPIKVHVK